MTTYNIYTGSRFGYYRSAHPDYETARAGASVHLETIDYLGVGQQTRGDIGYYYCYEAFVSFDTSGVTEPYSASVQLTGVSLAAARDFTLEARLYDWGSTVSTASWVAGDDLAALPLLGTWESSDWVPSWPDFNIFTSFSDNLNLSGNTKIILVGKNLTDGDPPAMVTGVLTSELATFNTTFVGEGEGSPAPRLVITNPDLGGWGVGQIRMGAN